MDTLCRHDVTATLRTLGVPNKTLLRGTIHEWTGLRFELDRFSAFGYGMATQHRFLHAPHPRLDMRSPVEILAQRDGITQVRRAVRETLAARHA